MMTWYRVETANTEEEREAYRAIYDRETRELEKKLAHPEKIYRETENARKARAERVARFLAEEEEAERELNTRPDDDEMERMADLFAMRHTTRRERAERLALIGA